MVRVAIILLVTFWATVTAGSLVWEVIDPASISAQPQPQAMPPGLRGEGGDGAAEPTLAELTPALRTSLKEQIAAQSGSGAPIELAPPPAEMPPAPVPPASEKPIVEAPPTAVPEPRHETASAQPALPSVGSQVVSLRPPRPRPEQVPVVLAPSSVTVPEKRPQPPPAQRGDQRVAEAQSLLASLGYTVGSVDGMMGPRTETALKAYERKSGLKVDGRVDDQLITRLRNDARTAPRGNESTATEAPAPPARQSLTGRVLGGVQRLIGHDFNSVVAPQELAAYCDVRGDEWIYDRGLDRMRSCADVVGAPKVAVRPLPGDR